MKLFTYILLASLPILSIIIVTIKKIVNSKQTKRKISNSTFLFNHSEPVLWTEVTE